MTIYYAGIGSRKTPADVLELMGNAAGYLESEGLILRSGGAEGADSAFFRGLKDERKSRIYIPWPGFQGFSGKDREVYSLDAIDPRHIRAAIEIAQHHHPAWDNLSNSVKRLMTRNVMQVLGHQLNEPAAFVLCWTPNGSGSGGTGMAIRVADHFNVPVFDLGKVSLDQASTAIQEIIHEHEPA